MPASVQWDDWYVLFAPQPGTPAAEPGPGGMTLRCDRVRGISCWDSGRELCGRVLGEPSISAVSEAVLAAKCQAVSMMPCAAVELLSCHGVVTRCCGGGLGLSH
jgi:hypothetical protein